MQELKQKKKKRKNKIKKKNNGLNRSMQQKGLWIGQ